MFWESRVAFNSFWSWAGAIGAVASILIAAIARAKLGPKSDCLQLIAGVTIGIWILLPPIFLWVDWVKFVTPDVAESAAHTHDLARNIWFALVIVLVAIFGVNPFKLWH